MAHRGWDQTFRVVADLENVAIHRIMDHARAFNFLLSILPALPTQSHLETDDPYPTSFDNNDRIALVTTHQILGSLADLQTLLEIPVVIGPIVEIQATSGIFPHHVHHKDLRVGCPFQIEHIGHILWQIELQMPESILLPEYHTVNLLAFQVDEIGSRNDAARWLPRYQLVHVGSALLADRLHESFGIGVAEGGTPKNAHHFIAGMAFPADVGLDVDGKE